VRLSATGLRMRAGPGRAAPAASLTATAQLSGQSARIDARVAAGSAQLAVSGQAPLGAGPLNLRASGGLDLTLLDPILTAGGRRARGRLTLDAAIAGTTAAPRVSGTAQLAGGEVQDFTQGLRVHDIAASLRADGDTIRIASLTGRAGPGTIAASGTVGVMAPGMPLDLAFTASNASPIASDQLQMNVDANLTLRGRAADAMNLGGRILIRRAEIHIPESLPPAVAALKVIRPGERTTAPQRAGPTPSVALDLQVNAPQQVFVRGRGVDAEMSGELRIRGSASQPRVAGGLDMRRGAISVAGTTLTFSRGKVGFDGTGVNGKIDPTLDFSAESTGNSVTATLAITGYVSAPKIKLSSVPDLPQDEVLAYLLFKRGLKDLGPFQYAEIAAALAQLSGVGGAGGLNPLESVRRGLGLDRLSVGGGTSGTSPTVEAGRYVANGVYLGAKQGTGGTGSGTGATLQIDITKGLKLETDVGTGTGGNQVGLTYQFEY
jgi:translocation and assembly module TamB